MRHTMVVLLLFSLCSCSSDSKETEYHPTFSLLYQGEGVLPTVMVNGIPELVIRDSDRVYVAGERDITRSTAHGDNCVSITLRKNNSSQETKFALAIYRCSQAGERTTVKEFNLGKGDFDADVVKRSVTFKATTAAKWAWETAYENDVLSDEDTCEISAVVNEYCEALRNRDIEAVSKLRNVAFEEAARAGNISLKVMKAEEAAKLKRMLAKATRTESVASDELSIQSYGRVVRVVGGQSGYIIKFQLDGKATLAFPELMFCKVNGHWVMVR